MVTGCHFFLLNREGFRVGCGEGDVELTTVGGAGRYICLLYGGDVAIGHKRPSPYLTLGASHFGVISRSLFVVRCSSEQELVLGTAVAATSDLFALVCNQFLPNTIFD